MVNENNLIMMRSSPFFACILIHRGILATVSFNNLKSHSNIRLKWTWRTN